jgi:hypothetical protein
MRLFLLFYLCAYGAINLYAFLKAKAAFNFGLRSSTGIALALFFVLMVLAPIIVRLSESAGHDLFARIMAYTGYIWMALVFLFFSASVLIDLYRLILWLSGLILNRDFASVAFGAKTAFMIPCCISFGICVYGYYEALNVVAEHIIIETNKLPSGVERFRIAQISDVHLGLIVREARLNGILDKVRKADADVVVSTGDLLDGQINGMQSLSKMLNDINPRYGKYAVTGNHEFFAGIKPATDFIESSGFRLLRGESASIGNIVVFAGIDDPSVSYSTWNSTPDEKALLSSLSRERFIILLKHRPLIRQDSAGLFDLQLSGHVHKGQIFPFSLLTKLYYNHHAGLLTFEGGALYISRGSGTWGPPIRFLASPEVTVIDIVKKKN